MPKIWTKKFEKFCPKYSGQNFSNFFVHILGNATTSYFRFEIYWPLTAQQKNDRIHNDHEIQIALILATVMYVCVFLTHQSLYAGIDDLVSNYNKKYLFIYNFENVIKTLVDILILALQLKKYFKLVFVEMCWKVSWFWLIWKMADLYSQIIFSLNMVILI